ncbi:MAG: hypothetical protein IKC72_04440 [Clostridia bacterium]|nr:hypothetical protein [Clostridia bacterium]
MKRMIFQSLGVLFSVVPPAVATLLYFPLWIERGAPQTVSGLCALLLILSAIPLLRLLKGRLGTPSLPLFWGVMFLLVRALGAIIDQVCVITFVGFASNLVGALFFHLSKRGEKE